MGLVLLHIRIASTTFGLQIVQKVKFWVMFQ